MNGEVYSMTEWIEQYAQDVIDGKKTLLQIERHLYKHLLVGNVEEVMKQIREAVSRRKKGNG